MAYNFSWLSVALPLLLGLLLSVATERALKPTPQAFSKRRIQANSLHLGSWLLLFSLLLMLTQRPWFSMATVVGVQLFLVVVNNVKVDSLKEPFLLQDFEYFWDMLKHPRLYIPFFGFWRTLLSSAGAIAVISIGLLLEAPLSGSDPHVFWLTTAYLLFISVGLHVYGLRLAFSEPFNPEKDFNQLGQIAFFWVYARALLRSPAIDTQSSPFLVKTEVKTAPVKPEMLANLVVVQSESFFDPRPLSPLIKDSLLKNYDRIRSQSIGHGRLEVPAWGANTVRTECAFLTGLAPAALGIHAFNPYRYLARNAIPNLAQHMRSQGYQTICIHPYAASFYLRDQVFPKLGFDRFIDIKAFSDTDKQGQYTGDAAVADRVAALLDEAASKNNAKPLFIFVITMENHGPLHLEKPDPMVTEQHCHQPLPDDCDDLSVYLSHILNADLMLGQLTTSLSQGSREGVLCWYGDHLPIMPTVYRAMQEVDGRTEYLIWRSGETSTQPLQQDLAVDQLAARLLGSGLSG